MSFLDRWFRNKAAVKLQPGLYVGDDEGTFVYGEESLKSAQDGQGQQVMVIRNPSLSGRQESFDRLSSNVSVSLRDLGINMEDLARPGIAQAAPPRKAGGGGGYQIPDGMEPGDEESRPESERIKEFSISKNNAGSQSAQPPALESLQQRMSRAQTALGYFTNDSIAGAAIRTLYEFVIGPGFNIEFEYNYEVVPPWFNTEAPEVAPVKAKFAQEQVELGLSTGGPGKKSAARDLQIFKAYMSWRAEELKEKLQLESMAVEFARDALVLGDAFGYRIDSVQDEAAIEDYEPKAEYLLNEIVEIQGLNPLAIQLEVDEFNKIQKALMNPQATSGGGGGNNAVTIPDLTKLLRLKWNGASYSIYGQSHLTPALGELALKASLVAASKASADRFSLPIRIAKYGVMKNGNEGGPMASPRMRDELASSLESFNPATDTLVVPFYNEIELIGTENGVEDLSDQINQSDRRIMMALGIPPNFLDSNFTSFATAKIQFTNTILKLRQLQRISAKAIETGVLEPWAKMRGYRNVDGTLIDFDVKWHRGELESDPAIIALIGILAGNVGQRILSRHTMRETLGFSSDLEDQFFMQEDAEDSQKAAELGLPQPGQMRVGPDGKPLPPGQGLDPEDPNNPFNGGDGVNPGGKSENQSPLNQGKGPTLPKTPKKRGQNSNPTQVNN